MFTNAKEGMQMMENSLAELIVGGIITYEDALGASAHPKELARAIESLEMRARGQLAR
jgi:Tfp pilus assembly ATPase PilU